MLICVTLFLLGGGIGESVTDAQVSKSFAQEPTPLAPSLVE